jgi:hypothetical protein
MESTDSQNSANRRVQGQSAGTEAVSGHTVALLSSLEAHNTVQEQIPSCNMGSEVNGHPAICITQRSSDDMTKLERHDDRVSLIQRVALAVSIL